MLDDTLVVWTTEFGRTPGNDGAKGRGHHPARASRRGWPAAASRAASSTARPTTSARPWPRTRSTSTTSTPPSCTCSGFDHEKLTYRHAGRDFRLTDVYGNVVRDILA